MYVVLLYTHTHRGSWEVTTDVIELIRPLVFLEVGWQGSATHSFLLLTSPVQLILSGGVSLR